MKGKVLWLTGLPCSGKTTLANEVSKFIPNCVVLDGDDIRASPISQDLGFSKEDREKNLFRVGFIAKLLSSKGVNVVCAFVSPYISVREKIRKMVGNGFIEVFVKATPEECEKRDTKGMWKRAKRGEIENFTGFSAPYEEPYNPEVVCDTVKESVSESAGKVLEYMNGIEARAFYIGRWQPFHKGHDYIIRQSLDKGIPVLVGIRDTYPSPDNPLSADERKKMIEEHFKGEDVKVVIIPNIRSVNIGRKVGYDIIKVKAPEEVEKISATKIRKKL